MCVRTYRVWHAVGTRLLSERKWLSVGLLKHRHVRRRALCLRRLAVGVGGGGELETKCRRDLRRGGESWMGGEKGSARQEECGAEWGAALGSGGAGGPTSRS